MMCSSGSIADSSFSLKPLRALVVLQIAAVTVLFSFNSEAQSEFQLIRKFGPTLDDQVCDNPLSLMQARDGTLLGTAALGPTGRPSIYRMSPDGSSFRVVAELAPGADPSPSEGLIETKAGSLVGVSRAGGDHGQGFVYRLNRDGSQFRVVWSFSGPDGARPTGKLAEGGDGFLYGTTSSGGSVCTDSLICGGVLFRVHEDGSDFRILKHFAVLGTGPSVVAATDGSILVSAYNLTTNNSGAELVRVEPRDGTLTLVHRFNSDLGEGPPTTLSAHSNGFVYGVDYQNLFRVKPDGSGFEILQTFNTGPEPDNIWVRWSGIEPHLAEGAEGTVWGRIGITTFFLESYRYVSLFRMDPDGRNLERFVQPELGNYIEIQNGWGTLDWVLGQDGKFYAPKHAPSSIDSHQSLVIRFAPASPPPTPSQIEAVHRFQRSPRDSEAPGLIARDGQLFGSTVDFETNGKPRMRFFSRKAPAYDVATQFSQDILEPRSGLLDSLVEGRNQNFYAVDHGTFPYSPSLYWLNTNGIRQTRPFNPRSRGFTFRLLSGREGLLYGVSVDDSRSSYGEIFVSPPDLSDLKELVLWRRFYPDDALLPVFIPKPILIEGSDGFLYTISDTVGFHGAEDRQVELWRVATDGSSVERTALNPKTDPIPGDAMLERPNGAFYFVSGYQLCRWEKGSARPVVIAQLGESIAGYNQREQMISGANDKFFVAASGYDAGIYYLRVFECTDNGNNRLLYQSSTAESPSGLHLESLAISAGGNLQVLTSSGGGTNGWGLFFELEPGGNNLPPLIQDRIPNQYGRQYEPLVIPIPADLFSERDAGQTLSLSASGFWYPLRFDSEAQAIVGVPTHRGTNLVTIRVMDNGEPPLTASVAFQLGIGPPEKLRIHTVGALYDAERAFVQFSGPPGVPVRLEATTNLVDWELVGASSVVLTGYSQQAIDNLKPSAVGQRFYRLRTEPE